MVHEAVLLAGWSAVWIITILLPPGSKEIETAYRINFLNGVVSSIAAGLAIWGYIDDNVATTATISYFFVDFVNILLNDHYFKVKSYQSPTARKVEYFHHILCFTVGMLSESFYQDLCTFKRNPFLFLLLAEISTPFLIAWRQSGNQFIGILFVISFIACRIIYHGFFFVPDCIRYCHASVGMGFGLPYLAMNFYFLYMIFAKLTKKKQSKVE